MVLTLIQGGDFVLAGGITSLVHAITGGPLIFYGQDLADWWQRRKQGVV
jgi:hypothetical protein